MCPCLRPSTRFRVDPCRSDWCSRAVRRASVNTFESVRCKVCHLLSACHRNVSMGWGKCMCEVERLTAVIFSRVRSSHGRTGRPAHVWSQNCTYIDAQNTFHRRWGLADLRDNVGDVRQIRRCSRIAGQKGLQWLCIQAKLPNSYSQERVHEGARSKCLTCMWCALHCGRVEDRKDDINMASVMECNE